MSPTKGSVEFVHVARGDGTAITMLVQVSFKADNTNTSRYFIHFCFYYHLL